MIANKPLKDLQTIFADMAIATAIIKRNEDSQWSIVWQNSAATSLWNQYDIDEDFDLKLALMDAASKTGASSFVCKLAKNIQPFRFIVSAYSDNDFLLQFLPEVAVSEYHGERRRKEDVYQLVIEGSKVGVFDWNIADDFISYSDKVYDLCGISHSELGNTLEQLLSRVHAEDVEGLKESFESHLEQRWPYDYSFRIKSSVGHYVWVQVTGKAVWNSITAEPMRFVGMMMNISARKNAEAQVLQGEALIEQIIDSLPISIYVKDHNGCFRFFSKQTEQDTGVSREEAIGRTVYEIFPTTLARQQSISDQIAITENRILVSEEHIQIAGLSRWLMLGKGPIKVNRNGEDQVWILGFSIDITQRKAVEEMLEQARDAAQKASQAKSEFLSVMSHEIRTPLNSVIGTAGLLIDTPLDTEQAQHVEMIKRSGEHLLHLINDILDFNKLDAGKMELESRPMDLYAQIKTVFAMCNVNARLKGIDLSFSYPEHMGHYFLGDEARFRQILLNLIGNAIKFTEKGSVTLKIITPSTALEAASAQRIRFEVIDTGIGIPADKISLLFSEFTQVDASTTRKFGGTGLGLSICKKLVEAMGGKIGILSKLGEGSTFWFEVPMEEVGEIEAKKEFADDLPELARSLNILVAEDNLPNQLLIKALLKKMGHEVVLAGNGIKAIEAIEEREADHDLPMFDLVLMDMQMPEMDGLEATAKIRALESDVSTIPIIALTANVMSGDRDRVIEAGMNDYLTKPIDLVALKRTLKVWGSIRPEI